ncbi:MAG: alpha/beta hydrolase [Bacteroidota bacterium]
MEHNTKGYNLTVQVNNFDLSYNDVGEGKITVIFLHGFPFDKSMWQLQIDALKSSYRAIACDIRGFGKSKDEESELSIDMFADDLIAFMDHLGIEKAIICGLSMGGYIALNAIQKSPNRFEALILCDTQCIADTAEVKAKRYETIAQIAVNGVTDFNEGFLKAVFHEDTLSHKKELVEKLRSVVFTNSQRIITAGLIALAERKETCLLLNKIAVSTLIICGREDGITPLIQSINMQTSIKGSQLKIIDLAGHVSNIEQPTEFNKHLLYFVSTIRSGGANES